MVVCKQGSKQGSVQCNACSQPVRLHMCQNTSKTASEALATSSESCKVASDAKQHKHDHMVAYRLPGPAAET
jgi:hypothetical protein